MFDSVRIRLTLWYAGVLALSLIAFALVIYYAAGNIFHERQDESLRSTAQTVASAYVEELGEAHSQSKAGEVVLAEITFPNRYVQLTDNTGNPIAASANLAGSTIAIPAAVLADARARGFSHATVNGLRVTVVPLSSDPDPRIRGGRRTVKRDRRLDFANCVAICLREFCSSCCWPPRADTFWRERVSRRSRQ